MKTRGYTDIVGYLDLDAEAESQRATRPVTSNARSSAVAPFDDAAAIYVHFPFCRHLCTYCDFDTFTRQEALIDPYVRAVVGQIRHSPRTRATSLYVGGGTPSLMEGEQAAAIVEACRAGFGLPQDAEVTIEANPSELEMRRLEAFRRAGFNRLSLGVQSVDDRVLRVLGRRHRAEGAGAAVKAARAAGFENLSIDLIYGAPLQTLESWEATLDTAVRWGVDHLSCYMLSLEAGTPLERGVTKGVLAVPEDDAAVAMYEAAVERLGKAGYRRYEISNFARPGFESAHNLTYWRNRPYLGIGAGAAGCWNGHRYKILPDLRRYMQGVEARRIPLAEEEDIDKRRSMSDTMILGLRLEDGIARADFAERYGIQPEEPFGLALEWAEEAGLLEQSDERVKLTHRGILLSNELFQRLL